MCVDSCYIFKNCFIFIRKNNFFLDFFFRKKIKNGVFSVQLLQEQELYQKEGLGVNEVRYVDNQDCIAMDFLSCQAFCCCHGEKTFKQRR